MQTIYTIGHSTRALDEFLTLLKKNHIAQLIDVRAIPASRRFPWFAKNNLMRALKENNIKYLHMPALGGRREPKEDSINLGLRNAGFRGYADYMQTVEFQNALKKLNVLFMDDNNVVIMCAEALPQNCHRSFIADVELIQGIQVKHIISNDQCVSHQLNKLAYVEKPGKIFYPNKKDQLSLF